MDMRNSNRSFTFENLTKELKSVERIKIDGHHIFDKGAVGILDNWRLWYGEMPSGRYVYLYSFVYYER